MIFASAKELYGMFVRSSWWIELSRRKRKIIRQCEECGSTSRLSCHHTVYPENWFDTKLWDLKVLCWPCHEKKHPQQHSEKEPPKVIPIQKTTEICPYTNLGDLLDARSLKLITREQFVRWKRIVPRNSKTKVRLRRRQRNKEIKFHQQQKKKWKPKWHYQTYENFSTGRRTRWQNRGASSN